MNHKQCKSGTVAALVMAALLSACAQRDYDGNEPPAAKTTLAPHAAVPAEAQFAVGTETLESLQGMTESATCSLENVVNVADNSLNPGDVPNSYKVETGKAYKMIGFATNKDAGTVPKTIRIVLAGAQVYGINAVTGSTRPDVARFFKVPTFSSAGYQIDAVYDNVAPGEYRVLVIETDSPVPVACPTHQTITIK